MLRVLDQEEFDTIREIVEASPSSGPVKYQLHKTTCSMHFKAPEGANTKDIEWSRSMAEFILRTGHLIGRLWAEVQAHQAAPEIAPTEPELELAEMKAERDRLASRVDELEGYLFASEMSHAD